MLRKYGTSWFYYHSICDTSNKNIRLRIFDLSKLKFIFLALHLKYERRQNIFPYRFHHRYLRIFNLDKYVSFRISILSNSYFIFLLYNVKMKNVKMIFDIYFSIDIFISLYLDISLDLDILYLNVLRMCIKDTTLWDYKWQGNSFILK